jgi:hypothetical protein
VSQEWVFFFFKKKVKLLPLVLTSASRLGLLKASELLCDEEALHILLPFLDNVLKMR